MSNLNASSVTFCGMVKGRNRNKKEKLLDLRCYPRGAGGNENHCSYFSKIFRLFVSAKSNKVLYEFSDLCQERRIYFPH